MKALHKASIAILALALSANPAAAADQKAATETAAASTTDAMTLDTPLEEIAANEAGKAILHKRLPGLTEHAMWETFKAMSLNQLAPMAGGQIPEEQVKLVATDLAALKKAQ